MQFKAVVVAAMAASVAAQANDVPKEVKQSVLSVLATAIPSSIIPTAVSEQPAFASKIVASVAAGETPAWYGPLPGDVKTLLAKLYPAVTTSAAPSSSSSSSSSSAASSSSSSASSTPAAYTTAAPSSSAPSSSAASTGASISGGASGSNSTTITSITTPTLSAPSSPSGTAPPANNAAAAGIPVAAMGSTIVGAMGVIGVFLM